MIGYQEKSRIFKKGGYEMMGHYASELGYSDLGSSGSRAKRFSTWLSLKKKIDSLPTANFTVGELRFILAAFDDLDFCGNRGGMKRLKALAKRK